MQVMFHSYTISPQFPALHRTVKTAQQTLNFMTCFERRATKRVTHFTKFDGFSRYSSPCGNWDSVPGQFTWDVGQTQRNWDTSLSQQFGFNPVSIILPTLHIHSSIIREGSRPITALFHRHTVCGS